MLCGSASLVKHGENAGVAVTLRCRSWGCPACAEVRQRQLRDLALNGSPQRFLTLTVSQRVGISPADRASRLADAARKLFKRARRAFTGSRLEYLCVFEATKRGEPHLHVLLRGPFLPQRWVSDQMRELLGSPIVDIRKVSNARHAAIYVAKYIGKAPHHFATCKRYWHSGKWVCVEPPSATADPWEGMPWEKEERAIDTLVAEWRRNGFIVTELGDGMVRYEIPPHVHLYFPRLQP